MGLIGSDVPSYGHLVKTMDEFFILSRHVVHFAVRRRLGYFHHYIVAGWENAKKKVFEYYVCFRKVFDGPGEVKKNAISEKEIKEAITSNNLYVIKDPDYPKTEEQKEQARKRCWERLGEKFYRLASNNCEHLVSYILKGISESKQIKSAGFWKMICIDTYDNLRSHFKRNFTSALCCLIAVVPVYAFVRRAADEILLVASETIVWYSNSIATATDIVIDKCTENLVIYACEGSQFSPSQIFASKKCTDVARASSKAALKKAIATNFLISGFVETCSAAYEINKLASLKQKGFLAKGNYDREKNKIVVGAVGATAGTVAGGAIGQALIPMPVIGYAIGSYLGRGIGRWCGSVVTGQCYDAC